MQNIRALVLVTSVAVLTACGGGGGGENTPEPTPTPTPVAATPAPAATPSPTSAPSATPAPAPVPVPSFAGNYSVNMTLSTNTCGGNPSPTVSGIETVSQNGGNVSIVSSGITFSGSVDADNGGFVVNSAQVISGVNVTSSVSFRTIAAGSTYSSQQEIASVACKIVYSGSALKI